MRCSSTPRTSTPATGGGRTSCGGCRRPMWSSRSSARTGPPPSTITSGARSSTLPRRTCCGSRWRRRCAGTRCSSRCSSRARRCRRVGSCRGCSGRSPTARRAGAARVVGAGLAAFADDLVERADRFHRDPHRRRRAGPTDPRTNGRTGASRAAWYMAQGSLVTIVGPGANAADRAEPWARGAASLPDTSELARHLAEWFDIEQGGGDLARVSQHISLSEGRADLCRTLHELLVERRRRAHLRASLPGGRAGAPAPARPRGVPAARDDELRRRARAGVRGGARALRPRRVRRRQGAAPRPLRPRPGTTATGPRARSPSRTSTWTSRSTTGWS